MWRACLILLWLGACSRYGILIDGSQQKPARGFVIDRNFAQVSKDLSAWLRKRGVLLATHDAAATNSVFFEQDWVRDSSLRYYYLDFDTRVRHLTHWKGVWRLRAQGPGRTELRMDLLELVFLGPANEAGRLHRMDGQWFESPRDNVRVALEMRRFWQAHYPNLRLPDGLAQIEVPRLTGPPAAKFLVSRPRIGLPERPRAF
jgi:hypothetical protein